MSINFTAIDFETANRSRGSVCSVGLVRVRDGHVTDEFSTYVHPPHGLNFFDQINTNIHGIRREMVESSPEWGQVLAAIIEFKGDDVLVAHNAPFDIGVIRAACNESGIEPPKLDYACTLAIARSLFDFPKYKLDWLVNEFKLASFDHHEAGADARACAAVCVEIAARVKATSMSELLAASGVAVASLGAESQSNSRRFRKSSVFKLAPNSNVSKDGPLFGQLVCFTGQLNAMTRAEACRLVSELGGTATNSVTKSTRILVTASSNPSKLQSVANESSKIRKARSLENAGHQIQIINELEFLQMVHVAGVVYQDS